MIIRNKKQFDKCALVSGLLGILRVKNPKEPPRNSEEHCEEPRGTLSNRKILLHNSKLGKKTTTRGQEAFRTPIGKKSEERI